MQTFPSNSEKFVPPLLALLLSTFVLTWLKDLSLVSRRVRVLAEATQRQSFWKEWIGSLETCTASSTADRALARQEIRRSARVVRQLYRYAPLPTRWTRKSFRGYKRQVGFFRRTFVAYAMPTARLVSYQRSFRLSVAIYLASAFLLSWLRHRSGQPAVHLSPAWLWFAVSVQQHNRFYLNALAICYLWCLVVMVVTRIRLGVVESHWLRS